MAAIVEGRRRMGEAISEGRWQREVDERRSLIWCDGEEGGDGGQREAEGGRVDLEIGNGIVDQLLGLAGLEF